MLSLPKHIAVLIVITISLSGFAHNLTSRVFFQSHLNKAFDVVNPFTGSVSVTADAAGFHRTSPNLTWITHDPHIKSYSPCATDPGVTGNIGATEIWLIDKQCPTSVLPMATQRASAPNPGCQTQSQGNIERIILVTSTTLGFVKISNKHCSWCGYNSRLNKRILGWWIQVSLAPHLWAIAACHLLCNMYNIVRVWRMWQQFPK